MKGTTGIYLIAIIILCLIVGSIFFFFTNQSCPNFNQATLQAPKQAIHLAIAETPKQQARGLGECKQVPENSGMYFPFSRSGQQTFWMRGMIIPIDIIWIQQGRVVGIEKNVPNVPLNTPDDDLPRYTSPEPVDAVLEVGTGMAQAYGLEVGATVGKARNI